MHQIYHCRAYIIQQNRATPRYICVRFIFTNLREKARGIIVRSTVRAIVHLRACFSYLYLI